MINNVVTMAMKCNDNRRAIGITKAGQWLNGYISFAEQCYFFPQLPFSQKSPLCAKCAFCSIEHLTQKAKYLSEKITLLRGADLEHFRVFSEKFVNKLQ